MTKQDCTQMQRTSEWRARCSPSCLDRARYCQAADCESVAESPERAINLRRNSTAHQNRCTPVAPPRCAAGCRGVGRCGRSPPPASAPGCTARPPPPAPGRPARQAPLPPALRRTQRTVISCGACWSGPRLRPCSAAKCSNPQPTHSAYQQCSGHHTLLDILQTNRSHGTSGQRSTGAAASRCEPSELVRSRRPVTHSMTSTRCVVRSRCMPGTNTRSKAPYRALNRAPLSASCR